MAVIFPLSAVLLTLIPLPSQVIPNWTLLTQVGCLEMLVSNKSWTPVFFQQRSTKINQAEITTINELPAERYLSHRNHSIQDLFGLVPNKNNITTGCFFFSFWNSLDWIGFQQRLWQKKGQKNKKEESWHTNTRFQGHYPGCLLWQRFHSRASLCKPPRQVTDLVGT